MEKVVPVWGTRGWAWVGIRRGRNCGRGPWVLGQGGGHACLNCGSCISRINNIDNFIVAYFNFPPTGISQAVHWTKKMKLRQ